MTRSRTRVLGIVTCGLLLSALAGCECSSTTVDTIDTGIHLDAGGDGGPRVDAAGDAGSRPDSARDGGGDGGPSTCGNGVIEGFEECDEGDTMPNDGCSATCHLECGDGMVTGAELCDTAIAAGSTGACPASCDDGMDCTSDSLSGVDCQVSCVHGDITIPAAGDGCCPPGADATTDTDCPAVCGNMLVEPGETCDTGITTGAGSCPTSCDDAIACSLDAMTGSACTAACTNTPITTPMAGDMCCPPGATPATDTDCTGCGDGVVVGPETCDTAIASGTGSCPTTCNDGMACTLDTLVGGGTCSAACMNTAIAAGPMDTCCPTGATIGTDPDCAARCGDMVVTAPETCDPPGGSCSATCMMSTTPLTAFRMTDLDIMEPHFFANVFGCLDVTNMPFGMRGLNPILQDSITMDGDMPPDGQLDLSIAHVFAPLLQTAGMSTPSYVVFPDCTAPMSSTTCTLPAAAMRTMGTAANMGGTSTCLGILTGTVRPYTPAIVTATAGGGANCYVANAGTVTFSLAGVNIILHEAQIAGRWVGSPATGITNGLLRGFLTVADATAAIIPAGTTGLGAIDGHSVASLLRGGAGSCRDAAPAMGDRDTSMAGDDGWYFYLNFSASARPYTEL
jgi:cysteine-rich repeat protein